MSNERQFLVTFQVKEDVGVIKGFLSEREYLLRILEALQRIPEVESGILTFRAEAHPFGAPLKPLQHERPPFPERVPTGREKANKRMFVAVLEDKEPKPDGRQRFDLYWLDRWPVDLSPGWLESIRSSGVDVVPGDYYVRGQCYDAILTEIKHNIESQRGQALFIKQYQPTVEELLAYEQES